MSTLTLSAFDRINTDFLEAYRAKDMVRKTSLGMLKSEITTWSKRFPDVILKDEQVFAIVQSQIKKIDQTIEQAGKVMDEKTLDTLMVERSLYKSYLPAQLSEETITNVITELLSSGPINPLGMVMGHFNQNFKGQFDNKLLKTIFDKLTKV